MATILVVEDEASYRELLRDILGDAGYNVLEASDGMEALGVARGERPDLVIVDLMLPTMDGYEFVRQLRMDLRIAQTPVIFHTGAYREHEARSLAQACGVLDVITKPVKRQVLLHIVRKSLKAAHLMAQTAPPPEEFALEHLRVLTNKLSEKVSELEAVNLRLAVLINLGQELATERDPVHLLARCCQAAREIIGARFAAIGILEDEGRTLRHFLTSEMSAEMASRFDTPESMGETFRTLLAARRPYRLCKPDPRDGVLDLRGLSPGISSLLGAPLASPTRVYGGLCLLQKLGEEAFSEEDEQLAVTLARQVAVSYENAKRYDEIQRRTTELEQVMTQRQQAVETLRQRNRELAILNAIAAVGSSPELSTMLATLQNLLAEDWGIPGGAIFAYTPGAERLALQGTWGLSSTIVSTCETIVAMLCPPSAVIRAREWLWGLDFLRAFPPLKLDVTQLPWHDALYVPLVAKDELQGVIFLFSPPGSVLRPDQSDFLKALGQQVGVALQNAYLFEQVRAGHARMETLSRRLLAVQEEERRHLSRELHDEIGQALTAVKINLQAVQRLPEGALLAPYLDENMQIVDRVLQQARDLALDLRPSVLDDLGLVAALRWFVDRLARRAGISARVESDPVGMQLPVELETVCFRISQEALSNIVRHARAHHIWVTVRQTAAELWVVIRDDGIGFDVRAARERSIRGESLGLLGMYERVGLVGGALDITSMPGKGTQLRARFPLPRAGSDREARTQEGGSG